MHQALLISEVLSEIFTYMVGRDGFTSTAAPAARVCRAWKDPALELIWESLDDPWILFATFLDIDIEDSGPKPIINIKYPTQPKWYMFDTYAKKVKRLQYKAYTESDQRRSFAMQNWIETRPLNGRPVFLSLSTLRIDLTRYTAKSLIRSIMSPSLRSLHLCISEDTLLPNQLVTKAQNFSPHIHTLRLEFKVPVPTTTWRHLFPLGGMFLGLPSLKQLFLDSQFLPNAFPTLSTIDTLERLEWSAGFPWKDESSIEECTGFFPSLQHVCGPIIGMHLAFRFLHAVRQSNLRKLAFLPLADDEITPSSVRLLMDTISGHSPSLQLLDISLLGAPLYQFTLESSLAELSPLFKCSRLHTLNLRLVSPNHWLNLSDTEFEHLVENFPDLKHILLIHAMPMTSLTLGCFQALAKHCRNIQSVRLQLDAREFEPIISEPVGGENNSLPSPPLNNLKSIDMDESPIHEADVESIAAYICSLSVNFDLSVTASSKTYEACQTYTKSWLKVGNSVRAYTACIQESLSLKMHEKYSYIAQRKDGAT